MSFSYNVKKELAAKAEAPKHCRVAQLSAMAAFCAEYKDGKVIFRHENELVPGVIKELLSAAFSVSEADCETAPGKLILANREKAEQLLMGIKWMTAGPDGIRFERKPVSAILMRNDCCKKAYLRGAFLCAGSVNDPNGAYHFEIVCKYPDEAEAVAGILKGFSLDVKSIERKKNRVVYLKDGSNITDALNLMGAFTAQMDFYNIMILKDMRNNVNRKVNCETANLKKTVAASVEQIKDIEYIRDNFGLEVLKEGLREVARLRLENPDASLKDLGEMLDPPLGRSGVNHRLKAISEFAKTQ